MQQGVAQLRRAGALLRVAQQGAVDVAQHHGRQVGPVGGQRQRGRGVTVRELLRRLRAERVRARECLVQHQGRGEDVGGTGDVLAEGLLRRHVGERAEQPVVDGRVGIADERDAEVGQLQDAVVAQQHVARLDVAVHDAVLVGVGQRIADRGHRAHDGGVVEHALAEGARQVVAAHQLEDHVDVVVVLDALEQPDDGRVVERRGDPHLAPGAPLEALVAGDRLQRDRVAAGLVDRLEDGTRAADAEHADDPEASGDDALGKKCGNSGRLALRPRRHATAPVFAGPRGKVANPCARDGTDTVSRCSLSPPSLKSSTLVKSRLPRSGAVRACPDAAAAATTARTIPTTTARAVAASVAAASRCAGSSSSAWRSSSS